MMRPRPLALSALFAQLALSELAMAQGVDEFGYYGASRGPEAYASPQSFALELRFGPYRPEIDDEFQGARPYSDTFGQDRRVLVGLEFDWQFLQLQRVGSLGVGVGLGYTRMTAGMRRTDAPDLRAEQDTALNILPAWTVAVARFDMLAHHTVIPLAFFGKIGPSAALWWVRDGNGFAKDSTGTTGKGRSDGFMLAGGAMLSLDIFDGSSARTLDASTGVNHSYLFAEWTLLDLGTSQQMLVGDSTWNAGLAMEF